MKTVMVRYKIKEDLGNENEALVRAVFDELRARVPSGLRYETFRLEDGVTFVHIARIATPDGTNPLTGIAAFKAFQKDLKDRCAELPVVTELAAIDAYETPAHI